MRLRIVYNFFTGGGSLIPSLCQNLVSSTRKSRTNVRQAVDDIRLRDAIPKNPVPQFVDKNKTWQNK